MGAFIFVRLKVNIPGIFGANIYKMRGREMEVYKNCND